MIDSIADRVEVLDDVVNREHAQAKPLVLETGRHVEVVRDELVHDVLSGVDRRRRE